MLLNSVDSNLTANLISFFFLDPMVLLQGVFFLYFFFCSAPPTFTLTAGKSSPLVKIKWIFAVVHWIFAVVHWNQVLFARQRCKSAPVIGILPQLIAMAKIVLRARKIDQDIFIKHVRHKSLQ